MTIEYKIRFENGGLTITQTTKPLVSGDIVRQNGSSTVLAAHEIGSSFQTARTKEGSDDVGPGGVGGAREGSGF